MKRQTGFVLVSVLIITSITTMLAFSQINENRLQERMGGNQQKELNARYAAEEGLFDAFEYIKAENAVGTSNADIETALGEPSFSEGEDYSFSSVTLDSSSNTFTLISKGEYYGATAYLKAQIEAVESSSIFDDAVVGCESVVVGGSSNIDSFEGASYATADPGTNGDVSVVNGYAVVDSGISGSVTVSGDGTAVDSKYVDANGDIYLGNNVSVTGNIVASGSFGGREEDVGGDVTTGASLDLGECDPLDIASNMPTYSGTSSSFDAAKKSTTVFNGTDAVGDVTPVTMEVLGESETVYVFDDFTSDDNNNTITVTGDVTLYIQGDMTIKNTTFSLANDSSSLTIFIDGNIVVNTGSTVFADEYVSDSGNVPLTVYSSNSDDTEIELGGNGEIYMNLYAPNEVVSYNGTAAIIGALRGKSVELSGTGDIHYDEGLSGIDNAGEATSASYTSVYYYYPESETTN